MKKAIIIVLILSTLFISGCWDMIEINQRIFPYSVGIDINENGDEKFNISYSYPNIYALGKNPTQKDTVYTISQTADSIFEVEHKLTTRLHYPIYNKHLKVMIISEDVAKNSDYIRQLLDGINRDYVINKMVDMLIVKQTAKELLDIKIESKYQEEIEGAIYSLLKNQQDSSRFTSKTVSDFIGDMDDMGASIIPLAHIGEKEFEISGGGVFKDYKIIGYVDSEENKAITILNNKLKADGIETNFRGKELSILGTKIKSKKKLMEKENLKIKYTVLIEGQIHEYTIPDGERIDNEEIINSMERALENEVRGKIENTIKRLQKDFNADVIGINNYLRKYHNKLWKEVENNWNEIFPDIPIDVDVVIRLRRRGLTK